jgi:uncharacterized protein YbaA (DUF1428 family)
MPVRGLPSRRAIAVLLAGAVGTAAGCSRDTTGLEPAPFPSAGTVFTDGFAQGVDFQAFSGSKVDALAPDATVKRVGSTALKVTIPGPGNASGGYAGGAFVASVARDLSGYDALTFWVRASKSAKLDVAGIGNDNTGTSRFTAQRTQIPVTTEWTQVTIPIPDATKLTQEKGMFYFAEGPEDGAGYDLWLDDIKFEKLGSLTPSPAIGTRSLNQEVGSTVTLTGTTASYSIGGSTATFDVAPAYFTFASSNASVATVSAAGVITVVGTGTTNITATLGATPASGKLTVTAVAAPTAAAATPTRTAADVISLFSNAYTNVPVGTWSADWDQADVADTKIAGNDVKKYSNMVFAGIEFTNPRVNATSMTHLHLDAYVYDVANFRVKLVDFGANGVFGGGDDSEHELVIPSASLTAGAWNSLDLPLANFTGLASRANLAQMILVASSPTVYLDNVYFYKVPAPPAPTAPTTAAPAPTAAAANVVSLFSDAYTNKQVDTWSADWDQADVSDVTIGGSAMKRYTNVVFAGIEFTSKPVDASAMTRFHMDIWTPDSTVAPANFKIKLVDFGPNNAFAGGDDTEHEITVTRATTPGFTTGSWIAIDVPMSDFTGLTRRANLAQLILSGSLKTFYVDNVYFYSTAAPTAPTTAATAPTFAAANVISLFSNAYTNVTVNTWSADWDQADLADIKIGNDDVKKYTNLVFAGIEFTAPQINATNMTHLMFDLWTPETVTGKNFRVKLVDFGPNGAFAGGDDTEHEITLTTTTTPALGSGTWVRLDLPLSSFTGLTRRANLAQLIISGDLKTVFVDNVLLHR